MASAFYEQIGRLVVRIAWLRFGRQIQVAGAVIAVLGVAVGYVLARRRPPEG